MHTHPTNTPTTAPAPATQERATHTAPAPTTAPDIAFFEPEIPGNTGTIIRLTAIVGSTLHLIEPFGFDLSEPKLKRAGLDYHDLANVVIYKNFNDFINNENVAKKRIVAFTTHCKEYYQNIKYTQNDILLFGRESTGLPANVYEHDAIATQVRIPMRAGLRSLNLANSASIAVYEAWRQGNFEGGV